MCHGLYICGGAIQNNNASMRAEISRINIEIDNVVILRTTISTYRAFISSQKLELMTQLFENYNKENGISTL